jgi:hypothetical protein
MEGTLQTVEQARDYAQKIEDRTGTKHLVFRVPEGTAAYEIGYRFATCAVDERAEYEARGAVFVEPREPK